MRLVNRSLAVLVLTLLCVNIADAGPLGLFGKKARDRRAARTGGSYSYSYQYQSGSTIRSSVPSCANGQCPLPQKSSAPVKLPMDPNVKAK